MDFLGPDSDDDVLLVEDDSDEVEELKGWTGEPEEVVDDLLFVASVISPTDSNANSGSSSPSIQTMTKTEKCVRSVPSESCNMDDDEVDDDEGDDEDCCVDKVEGKSESLSWLAEEEEENIPVGPPRTRNELDDSVVGVDDVLLSDKESLQPIGFVLYRIDVECTIVVQSMETISPLNEGSVLCLQNRSVLGRVHEVFGPITAPFYIVRWGDPPQAKANQATSSPFATSTSKKKKGPKQSVRSEEELTDGSHGGEEPTTSAFPPTVKALGEDDEEGDHAGEERERNGIVCSMGDVQKPEEMDHQEIDSLTPLSRGEGSGEEVAPGGGEEEMEESLPTATHVVESGVKTPSPPDVSAGTVVYCATR